MVFLIFEEPPNCFLWRLHKFTLQATVYKGSLFTTSLTTLIMFFFFLTYYIFVDNSHSDSYEVISHCGFNLHFLGDWWCWASFHVSVGHLCVFLGNYLFRSYRLENFSSIVYLSKFSAPFFLYSPSGTPVMWMLVSLMLPQRSLNHHFENSFFCWVWVVTNTLSSSWLTCSSVSSNFDSY